MSKVIKKFVVILTLLPFLAVVLLCCCLSRLSHADSLSNSSAKTSSCHTHEDGSNVPEKEDCGCSEKQILSEDSISNINFASSEIVKIFPILEYSVVPLQNFSLLKDYSDYLHGPPGTLTAVPIYIQLHNFRL
jgi:hypothetical protein